MKLWGVPASFSGSEWGERATCVYSESLVAAFAGSVIICVSHVQFYVKIVLALHETNLHILDGYPAHFMNGETEAQNSGQAGPGLESDQELPALSKDGALC